MIDTKLLRDEFASVAEQLATRGLPENFDQWPSLDARRKKVQQQVEEIRSKKNRLGPEIAKAKKSGENADILLADLKQSSVDEASLSSELEVLQKNMLEIEHRLPNIPHESVPVGKNESSNRLEKEWGEKRELSFTPKAHWDIGEELGILDFERAAKLSGARFALYKGDGARLERALYNFMLEEHTKSGYKEIIPPHIVRSDAMFGSGQLPKFASDAFQTTGDEDSFYLMPTSEVALCNLHAGEIVSADQLPLCYTAFTPCFRKEAGSYGKDVRGLIRLHQFNKVELVKICDEETSFAELEKLTRNAEGILEKLQLPYRRMTLCTGDMGIAAAKTYDLEVWLPSASEYREISSCSNTCDYQSRRNKTRYRTKQGEKPRYVHMLNGSGLAVGRTFLAVLENYQQADGSLEVPEVLQSFLGGQTTIRKA